MLAKNARKFKFCVFITRTDSSYSEFLAKTNRPARAKRRGFLWHAISSLVPGVGVEPTNPFGSGILSPLRKPFRHPGIVRCGRDSNPRIAVLQTAALPLRHRTSVPYAFILSISTEILGIGFTLILRTSA